MYRKNTCMFLNFHCSSLLLDWLIPLLITVSGKRFGEESLSKTGDQWMLGKRRTYRAAEVGFSGKSRSADVDPNWAEKSHEIRLSGTSCFSLKQCVQHKRTFSILKLPFLSSEPGSQEQLFNISTHLVMAILEDKLHPVIMESWGLPAATTCLGRCQPLETPSSTFCGLSATSGHMSSAWLCLFLHQLDEESLSFHQG